MGERYAPPGAEQFKAGVPMDGPERIAYLQEQRHALENWHSHQGEPGHKISMPNSDRKTTVGSMSMTEDEYLRKIQGIDLELHKRLQPK